MSEIHNLIEIVYDPSKRKLRARSIQDGRWVRFPNKLRKENKIFLASSMKKGNGDSWIAGGTISEFPLSSEKNVVLEEILNIKNKALLKQFYTVLHNPTTNKSNTEMLNLIFLVKKIFPNVDEQLLLPLMKFYSHSAFISSDLLLPLQNMLQIYNEKRVISIFSSYEKDDFLEDTVEMYQRIFDNDLEINEIMPKAPKNIRELHSIFWRELSKIKVPKNKLNQQLDSLKGAIVGNFKIFVPETTHDLINIGNTLSICVGNGYYGEKVMKKQSQIVSLVNSENKYCYCVEFSKTNIIQARGFANKEMDRELQSKLQGLLKGLAA